MPFWKNFPLFISLYSPFNFQHDDSFSFPSLSLSSTFFFSFSSLSNFSIKSSFTCDFLHLYLYYSHVTEKGMNMNLISNFTQFFVVWILKEKWTNEFPWPQWVVSCCELSNNNSLQSWLINSFLLSQKYHHRKNIATKFTSHSQNLPPPWLLYDKNCKKNM